MTDVIYKGGQNALIAGSLAGTPDLRLLLVMSNFTGIDGGGEEDAEVMADFADLDEFDGIGYVEIDGTGLAWSYDVTAKEYRLALDDDQWNVPPGTVAPGTRDAIGILVKLYVDGTDANDIPVGFTQEGGFPTNANNGDIFLTVNADGLMFLRAA